MKSILFICMGNICRSPAAEGIFKHTIQEAGTQHTFLIDSAGMTSYHSGQQADSRMRQHGQKRGYSLDSISRAFDASTDFDKFDMLIAMDQHNINDLEECIRTDADREKIHLMTDFLQELEATHIPDPYYGGDQGFEHVFDLLEDACDGLFKSISE